MMGKGAMLIIVRTVLLFWLLMQPSTSSPFSREATVIVKNDLGGGKDLVFHCMSADNDLGVKDLHSNETFEWRFGVNFLKRTLFHCTFAWTGASHKFEIYNAKRDYGSCDVCSWIVRENAPCRVFPTHLNCFFWNS